MMSNIAIMLKVLIFSLLLEIYVVAEKSLPCEPPCLYIGIKNSIYRMELNKTTGLRKNDTVSPQNLYKGRYIIQELAIDPMAKHIYWSDAFHYVINKSSIDGSNPSTVYSNGLGKIASLALDWSSDNLYWLDEKAFTIVVTNIKTNATKILFNLDEENRAVSIAVDPRLGLLFWAIKEKSSGRIECSNLDGTNRKVIVTSNVEYVYDLKVAYIARKLLYINGDLQAIESINLDGTGRKTEFNLPSGNLKFSSFAVHSDLSIAYIAAKSSIYMVKNSAISVNGTAVELHKGHWYHGKIDKIRLLEISTLAAPTPCLNSKLSCSHMCLKSKNGKAICACPTGMRLFGKKSCAIIESNYDIVYIKDGMINEAKYSEKASKAVTISTLVKPNKDRQHPALLAYDVLDNTIYWSDGQKIYSIDRDDLNKTVKTNLASKVIDIAFLNYDSISKTFITMGESFSSGIVIISVDGNMTRKIPLKNYGKVKAMLYHDGNVYYTNSKILRRIDLLTEEEISYPEDLKISNLAIDVQHRSLYWYDLMKASIQKVDLDFRNRVTIFSGRWHYTIDRFYIHGDKLYWYDSRDQMIMAIDKFGKTKEQFVTAHVKSPQDWIILKGDADKAIHPGYCSYRKHFASTLSECSSDKDCSPKKKCCALRNDKRSCTVPFSRPDHPCLINNGRCSHFCLGNMHNFKCACPNDMKLTSNNNKMCIKYTYGKLTCRDVTCSKRGSCISYSNGVFDKCNCTSKKVVGRYCELNAEDEAVSLRFLKNDSSVMVTQKQIKSEIAKTFNIFCLKHTCEIINSDKTNVVTKKKREVLKQRSSIRTEDVKLVEFENMENDIRVKLYITKEKSGYTTVMKSSTIKKAFGAFDDTFGKSLGVRYLKRTSESSRQVETSSSSNVVTVLIVLIVICLIVAAVFGVYQYRKRNRGKFFFGKNIMAYRDLKGDKGSKLDEMYEKDDNSKPYNDTVIGGDYDFDEKPLI